MNAKLEEIIGINKAKTLPVNDFLKQSHPINVGYLGLL